MSKSQKRNLRKILITAFLLIACTFPGKSFPLVYLIPYIIIAYSVLKKAFKNILNGQVFDENFLMAVASLGAIGIGEYTEAVAVILFYEIGELFESIAVGKSRNSVSELMQLRPDTAFIERDGEIIEVDPYDVSVGDIIVVKPGEKIPLDGTVIFGKASVDTMALTGESVPSVCGEGDSVISGCVPIDGLLKIRVDKEFDESTVAKILELVENSSLNKAKSEDFTTKFARWYTPIVVFSAVLIAIVPLFAKGESFADWFNRALIFLVVSCPCALVVSIPLSYFGGIGGASKKGILIKGSNYLEAIADAKIAVFDKTGTLTKGKFEITETIPENCSEDELIRLASIAEGFSNHPIAAAICENHKTPDVNVRYFREIPGKGIEAETDIGVICAGNLQLMREIGIDIGFENIAQTAVYVALNGQYKGVILLEDSIKHNVKDALSELKKLGIRKTVMLTGDNEEVAKNVAQRTGIDEVYAKLLPQDKVSSLEKIMASSGKGVTVYVGDGINDAPVIMRADVGIAMGGLGSDAALEAADMVLMKDDIEGLCSVIKLAKKTRAIVIQNVIIALGVKIGVMALTAFGITSSMWLAVFADVGVLIIAILNAIRTLR